MAAGLRGALLLARGRAAGLMLIDPSAPAALRSFRVALFCLPVLLLLRLLGWSEGRGPPGGAVLALAAETVGFVLAWAGFALASLPVADALGRRARWPLFLAAWNYSNVVQYGVLLAATGLPLLVGLPGIVTQALGLVALGYIVWLEWFVVRVALGVSSAQAVGLVVLDLLIGVFVAGLVARLALGG
jgi:hypothetical protein